MCAGRESNSGLVRGRDVYYHCTTGADVVVVSPEATNPTQHHPARRAPSVRVAKTDPGQEAMAQWQRVGFQTQRLGVRIPLASYLFQILFLGVCPAPTKQKNALPKLGIAPRLPRPQRGVLLLDYFGVWRIRVSIPVLNLAKVVCYHVQQSPEAGVRPSGLEPESYPWKG